MDPLRIYQAPAVRQKIRWGGFDAVFFPAEQKSQQHHAGGESKA